MPPEEEEELSDVEDPESDAPPPPEGETDQQAKIKRVNQEARNLRKRLREAEDKLAEADRAKLSDAERLTTDLQAAQEASKKATAELQRERLSNAVMRVASRLDLDPELADQLVRPDSVEFDEEGQPTGVEDRLNELVKRWPNLKKAPTSPPKPAPGGPTNPSRQGERAALTLDQVKAMSQNEIVARWEEVQAVLAANK